MLFRGVKQTCNIMKAQLLNTYSKQLRYNHGISEKIT